MGCMAVIYWTWCCFTLLYGRSVQTGCIFLCADQGWTWQSIKSRLGLSCPWKEQQCPPLSPSSSLGLAPASLLLLAGRATRARACWSQPGGVTGYERPWAEGKARPLLSPQHSLMLAKKNYNISFFFNNKKKEYEEGERESVGVFLWEGLRCCDHQLLSEEGSLDTTAACCSDSLGNCHWELPVCGFDACIFLLNFLFPSRLIRRIRKGTIQCRDLKFFSKSNWKGNKCRKKWQSSFEKGN